MRLPTSGKWPDPERARDAVAVIRNELPYSSADIRVVVKNGRVTLEGEGDWQFQRERAETVVRRVRGIKDVVNTIEMKPKVELGDLKRQIEEAFTYSEEIDADRITVEGKGSEVGLQVTVRSWAERAEAARTAWRASGISKVVNQITIDLGLSAILHS